MKNTYFIILLLSMPLFSCTSTDKYDGYETGVENARLISKRLKRISRGRCFLVLNNGRDRFYYSRRDSSVQTCYYIELPKLPAGFYLKYESGNNAHKPFPVLQNFSQSRYSGDAYQLKPLNELYVYENYIIIRPVEKEHYLKILFISPQKSEIIDYPDEDFKTKYYFSELINTQYQYIMANTNGGVWSIYKLKSRKSSGSPSLQGIIAAGIIYINSSPYLVGETISCYFSFSLVSGEVILYDDASEFNSFINTPDCFYLIAIRPLGYYEYLDERIRGKKRVAYYTETSP